MNDPIRRLFWVALIMIFGLVASTSWWTIVKADELNRDRPEQNRRALLRGLKIKRGAIRAADGTVLARSLRGDGGVYRRTYPEEGLFAHALGYSYLTIAQAGLEAQYNEELSGKQSDVESVLDDLRGRSAEGDRLQTTLVPAVQRAALEGLAGRKGSVVALDPKTGAVLALVSTPGFDPNQLGSRQVFEKLNRDEGSSPLFNRATQAGYAPGSTMKVVTAIAAIDSGRFTPDSRVNGKNGKLVSGAPLNNFGDQDFGDITLTEALTKSVNTVWATVGEEVGKATMRRYMARLGFGERPPIDLPSSSLRASGTYRKGRLVPVTSRFVDVGRMAIGQAILNVTPLQMAMVDAAVANGGELMEPRLAERVVDADGRTKKRFRPRSMGRVMSERTARQVTEMMTKVVEEGSGTAAALQGISVAGKTGTAERNLTGLNQPWFTGFAPVGDPEVVVAATVESVQGGIGGEVAAPIAKQVMEAALRG